MISAICHGSPVVWALNAGYDMLRIEVNRGVAGTVVRASGRLAGQWIGDLLQACEHTLKDDAPAQLTLDLSDVSFVANEAVAPLRSLVGRGTRLQGCPAYLMPQLEEAMSK